jgi:hypothetical protein
MNFGQTSRVLKSRGINGLENMGFKWVSPEAYTEILWDDNLFFSRLAKCQITMDEYDKNASLFVLFRYSDPFRDRMTGKKSDNWFSKTTFGDIAQECYDILNAQPDLEDWQVKLKDEFRLMI